MSISQQCLDDSAEALVAINPADDQDVTSVVWGDYGMAMLTGAVRDTSEQGWAIIHHHQSEPA